MTTKPHQWSNNAGSGIPNPPGFHPRPNHGYAPIFNGKPCMTLEEYDGKRLRKTSMRKTVDYNCSVLKYLEDRVWQRGAIDRPALQPDVLFYPEMHPPMSYLDNPINAVCTRFVRTATNKMRCPIFCMAWTPEGRRLITGASSGEFTLWNALTFNFETILQAHDVSVRSMVWSHNDQWMVTGDHSGYIKYWQMNMNNVKMFQAHKEPVRDIRFSPLDHKLVTCSDDGTVRIWDFLRCHEEKVLRGHGSDVKCCDWHPYKSLIASGSKDNQQPIRLWDPKSGSSLATLHAHKATVTALKFNANGNWLLSASRDHLLKLYDLRKLTEELQVFRGHKKEVFCVSWHPIHETLVASGGSDGAIMFWNVGADKEVGCIEQAHDSLVWTLSWHPLGHVLASGSNDHTSRFWTRNRPGDTMLDKYNLNVGDQQEPGVAVSTVTTAPKLSTPANNDATGSTENFIPGMAPEDRVEPPVSAPNNPHNPSLHPHPQQHTEFRHMRRPNRRFAHQWDQNWHGETEDYITDGGAGIDEAGDLADNDVTMTSQRHHSRHMNQPHYPGAEEAWTHQNHEEYHDYHGGAIPEEDPEAAMYMEEPGGAMDGGWDYQYHEPPGGDPWYEGGPEYALPMGHGGGEESEEFAPSDAHYRYAQTSIYRGGRGEAPRGLPARGGRRRYDDMMARPHPHHAGGPEMFGDGAMLGPPADRGGRGFGRARGGYEGFPDRGGANWRGGMMMRRGSMMPGPPDARGAPWRGPPRGRGMRPGRPRRPPIY